MTCQTHGVQLPADGPGQSPERPAVARTGCCHFLGPAVVSVGGDDAVAVCESVLLLHRAEGFTVARAGAACPVPPTWTREPSQSEGWARAARPLLDWLGVDVELDRVAVHREDLHVRHVVGVRTGKRAVERDANLSLDTVWAFDVTGLELRRALGIDPLWQVTARSERRHGRADQERSADAIAKCWGSWCDMLLYAVPDGQRAQARSSMIVWINFIFSSTCGGRTNG